jgi:hypothetical protein
MVACLQLSALGAYLLVTLEGKLDLSFSRFYDNLLIILLVLSLILLFFSHEKAWSYRLLILSKFHPRGDSCIWLSGAR